MKTTTRIMLAFFALAAAAAGAGAKGLPDPTRPPGALRAPSAAVQARTAPQAPRLQSILIARAPGGRHIAVIDGQTVRPGDKFRGALVERMTQTEVVLSQGGRKQVLKLFPAQPAAPQASAKQEN